MKPIILRWISFIYLSILICISTSCSDDETRTPSNFEPDPENPATQEDPSTKITGCIDPYAINFDTEVKYSDNSCTYASVSCSNCDFVLENTSGKLDNNELKLPPGSVIGIKSGDRQPIDIRNFHGTEDAPFIFTNCDGKAIVSLSEKPEAIRIRNSSYIRLTGTGSPNDLYGIEIKNGTQGLRAYEKVNDLEVDHLEISKVGIGIWSVTRPTCDGSANKGNYVQKNTVIHHNYIHDVHGEGMYIGGSKWENGFDNNDCPGEKLLQPDLIGVRVFNNLVENTGWDGIQVGGAIEDCEIYNNSIKNYGTLEKGIHQAGLMINPGTTGKIYSNTINGGTGNAIHVLGFNNLIYSNTISGCQMNAIHVGDRNPLSNMSYRILNNTIINNKGKALHFNSKQSINNIFYNNFMAGIEDDALFSIENNIDVDSNILTALVSDYPFEEPTKGNFTPTLNSNLLDAGKLYEEEDILVDVLMRKRKVGKSIDIGAFENQKAND